MRLLGCLIDAAPHMAVQVADGGVAPIGPIDEFYGELRAALTRARAVANAADEPGLALGSVEQVPAVPSWSRTFCVGLNYHDHAKEAGLALPDHPTIFSRFRSSLTVDGATIRTPVGEDGLDWEGELAAVVGVPTAQGWSDPNSLLGLTAFNDVSARNHQLATTQWTLGKNADATGVLGPAIVTTDELAPTEVLDLVTTVNGSEVQRARTDDMIFSVTDIAGWVSEVTELAPGDVLALGTPAGVGHARIPPVFMQPGDEVAVTISRIGTLTNTIV